MRIVVDGIYYALGLTAGGIVLSYFLTPWLGIPLYLLAAFCLYFFRDPDRKIPPGDVVVSPADGKVVSVRRESPERTRISIFLNVFDVHVNRAPIGGRIADVSYSKGKFLVASREVASTENEQNTVTLNGQQSTVTFSQIAGLIARRIVFFKSVNDTVSTGERVGLIKFGSRVDVFLGPEWELAVASGQRVSAGSSILAKKKGNHGG